MLAEVRGFARGVRLATLLVTLADDNIGSRRVIERNGGVVSVKRGTVRYELATAALPRGTRTPPLTDDTAAVAEFGGSVRSGERPGAWQQAPAARPVHGRGGGAP